LDVGGDGEGGLHAQQHEVMGVGAVPVHGVEPGVDHNVHGLGVLLLPGHRLQVVRPCQHLDVAGDRGHVRDTTPWWGRWMAGDTGDVAVGGMWSWRDVAVGGMWSWRDVVMEGWGCWRLWLGTWGTWPWWDMALVLHGHGVTWPWRDVAMVGHGHGGKRMWGMGTWEGMAGDTGDVAVGGTWSWRDMVLEGCGRGCMW